MLIIILLILQSIPIRSTIKIEKKNNSQKFNEVCQTLKSSQANRSDILLIGSTMKRFIIITKNFDVYDLENNNLNLKIDQIFLLGSKPIALNLKYPKLFRDANFQQLKRSILNAFVFIGDRREFLCFTGRTESVTITEQSYTSLCYDLNNDVIEKRRLFAGEQFEIPISTDLQNVLYEIRRENQSLALIEYQIRMKNRQTRQGPIRSISSHKLMCLTMDQRIVLTQSSNCEHPITHSIYQGFVVRNRFYLFGDNGVMIFSQRSIKNSEPTALIEKTFDSFFNCPPSFIAQSSKTHRRWMWTMIGTISLLLIALCAIMFVRYTIEHKNFDDHHQTMDSRWKNSNRFEAKISRSLERSHIPGVGFLNHISMMLSGAGGFSQNISDNDCKRTIKSSSIQRKFAKSLRSMINVMTISKSIQSSSRSTVI